MTERACRRYVGQFGRSVQSPAKQDACRLDHPHWACYLLGVWHAESGLYQPMPTPAYQVYVQTLLSASRNCSGVLPFFIQRVDGEGNIVDPGPSPVLDTDLNGNKTMQVPHLDDITDATMDLAQYTARLRKECEDTATQTPGGHWISYVHIMGDQDTVDVQGGGLIRHTILIVSKNTTVSPVFKVEQQAPSGRWSDLLFSDWLTRYEEETYSNTTGFTDVAFPTQRVRWPRTWVRGFFFVAALCSIWLLLYARHPDWWFAILCLPKVVVGLLMGSLLLVFGHATLLLGFWFRTRFPDLQKGVTALLVSGSLLLIAQAVILAYFLLTSSELERLGIPAYWGSEQVAFRWMVVAWAGGADWSAPLVALWVPVVLVDSIVTAVGVLQETLLPPSALGYQRLKQVHPQAFTANPYRRLAQGGAAEALAFSRNRYRTS